MMIQEELYKEIVKNFNQINKPIKIKLYEYEMVVPESLREKYQKILDS